MLQLALKSCPSLTELSLVISCSHARKANTNKTSSSQLYSDRTKRKQNKSQVSRRPSCRKTTKGSLQNVSWARFRRSRKPRVLFTTLLLESQTSLQTTNPPPSYTGTPWRTHKSTRGPMYSPTSNTSNGYNTLLVLTLRNS